MDDTRQPTVMVVDDNPDIAQVIADMVMLLGLHAVVCLDSESAYTRMQDVQPDLVILDVEMPGLDGIDLFNRLRDSSRTAMLRVIFFTASPHLVTTRLVDYKARGAALIVKPNVHLLAPLMLQTLAKDRTA